MLRRCLLLLMLTPWLFACTAVPPLSQAKSCIANDVYLYNATIYTVDDALPTAEAVAIKDGRFVFVGTQNEGHAYECGARITKDMAGAYVYPGLTDGHQHLEGVGRRTRTLSLFGITSLQSTINAIEAWADNVPDGEWVLGRGWIEREWTDEQRFLNASDVDAFTSNKPLFMPRADGVSALVNSKALALAGVDKHTPDPEGGKFERDAQGNPTGYVLANAMNVFRELLPTESDAYRTENLLRGMQSNAAMGWTQTHDAGMAWRDVELLKALHGDGQMLQRMFVAVPIKETEQLVAHGKYQSDDGLLDLRGIKVFIDGTLGSRGAALLQRYADANHRGFMNRTTKAELMPVLDIALRDGFQVMTHVIGDRALNRVLDWYGEAFDVRAPSTWATTDLRWRLEHAQIIIPEDQTRLIAMGIIPSMQPSHAIGDLNFAPARLGMQRLAHAYPWQPLIDQGAKIIAGSDAPVEAGDPRIEFYAAITRQRLDGSSGEGWYPEYAVSRQDALKMLTLWPAYGIHREDELGSITVGKYADMSVFDTDFMQAPAQEILSAKVLATYVNGQVMYRMN